ncbi:GTP-binding protein [Desulfosporosinus sp. Sb-LF]|nr:GTP-binding protein [Desulfosporosinus sp. Sb-LF]
MVKFDIVSGFLGAGKTSLIKKILKSLDSDEKIVLIENEFGDVNVDREVLDVEGFEVYELSNGCVCCKLKGDFLLTLKQILNQKVDRIIFEPSGIFILGEILDLFKDPEISNKCVINSVTTVVDAQNFSKHIQSYTGFFKSQISCASTLVVSKSQSFEAEELSKLEAELRWLNGTAKIISKNWVNLSNQEITSIVTDNLDYVQYKDAHVSKHGFESVGLKKPRDLYFKELENILKKCKDGFYGNVVRGKGIIKSEQNFLEFNYVDGHYAISESTGISEMVSFIGKNLEKETLIAAFQ